MLNQDLIELNELNKNSNGGTEITTRELFNNLPRDLLENFQFITSRVRDLKDDKIKIYHLHDLPGDPESIHLKEESSRKRFDNLVFVSNWQYQQYRNYLGVPYDNKSTVIQNGIHPLVYTPELKSKDKIKIIYTPTPHRGLNILVKVFIELAKNDPSIELHVFSSFEIYGWKERDIHFKELFDICKSHPQIVYHGFQPQDVVRKAYEESHIFAYPSTWQETSCRCLIEAMSAGCLAVHPNYGALPETARGRTFMYDGSENIMEHANNFYHALHEAIEIIRLVDEYKLHDTLYLTKQVVDEYYSWKSVTNLWEFFLKSCLKKGES